MSTSLKDVHAAGAEGAWFSSNSKYLVTLQGGCVVMSINDLSTVSKVTRVLLERHLRVILDKQSTLLHLLAWS